MSDKPTPIPEGFHRITPHLVVRNAAAAMDFYKRAFGAEAAETRMGPDGKSVMHAEMKIGDSHIFLNDEYPEYGSVSPLGLNGSAVTLHLYVDDADAAFKQAVDAGAEVVFPLADQFWGDRYGIVKDPSGHKWSIGCRVEQLTPEECSRRAEKWFAEQGS